MNSANRNKSNSPSKTDAKNAGAGVRRASISPNKIKSRSNSITEKAETGAKHRSLSKKSRSSRGSVSETEAVIGDEERKSKNKSKNTPKKSTRGSRRSDKTKKSDTKSKSSKRSKSPKGSKKPADVEDLCNQGLATLSVTIFQKTHLRQLLVSGNNIRALPASLKDLVNLEYLDVSKNPLKIKDANDINCFPVEMRLMKSLKRLNISECNLRHLPSVIWLIPTIEHLDISRNKISLLVPEIGNLQNLKILNLSQCDLATLPAEIGFCTELVEIILWGNQVEFLPDTLKECEKLQQLKMSYRSFHQLLDTYMENLIKKGQIKSEHIPLVVFELVNLRTLDLSSTKINNLPENNLKNLVELHLDNNFCEQLPETIFQCMFQTLKVLTSENNFLTQLPSEIKLLESLELLNLANNKLTVFPNNDQFNLLSLTELYLNNNQIMELTSSIGVLKNLRKLGLNSNKLTQLPECLYDLTELDYLDLSYNLLTRLSNSIIKLTGLKCAHSYSKLNKIGLWLLGNPLVLPPQNIWKTKSIDKIYSYLTTFYNRDINFIYYSKLVFIGETGAGKSCIIDCMINPLNIKDLLATAPNVLPTSSSAGLRKKCSSALANEAPQQPQRNSVVNFISTPLDMNSGGGTTGGMLAPKMSLQEQYTPMSKTNSVMDNNQMNVVNGMDSAGLVRNLNLQTVNDDGLTKIVRKLYLRTKDKFEFGILDLAGEQTYHYLYPLFLSTIDYENQPTIFVLVYSHSEYTTILHDKLVGNWLKHIFMYTNCNGKKKTMIRIKLVGIKSDLISDADDDYYDLQTHKLNEAKKHNEIIENCYQTINLCKKQLQKERFRLEELLKKQQQLGTDDENIEYIKQSIELIAQQLDKDFVFVNSKILIIRSDSMQNDLSNLLDELQGETKRLNKCAPIQLRDQLKKIVLKYDRMEYKADLEQFLNKVEEHKEGLFTEADLLQPELEEITTKCERVVDYMSTVNDIFWLKMNPKYRDHVFHRVGFFLKCLQLIVSHDLDVRLDYSRNRMFKQLGLYDNEIEFMIDLKLFKTYGFFHDKMLDALWFLDDYSTHEQENCLDLFQDLLVAYRAEVNISYPHQPKVRVIMPNMCSNHFKKVENEYIENKTSKVTIADVLDSEDDQRQQQDIVEIGREENYFIKMDKIREYENIMKLIQSEKKEKAIWNLNQLTYENEDEEEEKSKNEQRRSALSAKLRGTINIISNKDKMLEEVEELDESTVGDKIGDTSTSSASNLEFMNSIADEFKYIKSYLDVAIDLTPFKFKHKYHIDLIFTLDVSNDLNSIFHKFSILLQDHVSERLDSNDCIIARDNDNNFVKIEVIRKFSPAFTTSAVPTTQTVTAVELNNKILIDVKTRNIESVENFKSIFDNLIDITFSFYPGIAYLKQTSLIGL